MTAIYQSPCCRAKINNKKVGVLRCNLCKGDLSQVLETAKGNDSEDYCLIPLNEYPYIKHDKRRRTFEPNQLKKNIEAWKKNDN